jgi:TonB family protein
LSRLALGYAVAALALGCVSARAPSASPPLALGECATRGPRYPDEAKDRRIVGPVVVDLSIDETGRVVDVKEAAAGSPILLSAVRVWASNCTFVPAMERGKAISSVARRVFAMHPPRTADPSEPPVIDLKPGDGIVRPTVEVCDPGSPTATIGGRAHVSYVVHRDGHADSVLVSPGSSGDVATLFTAWVESCWFRPARRAGGIAIPTRMEEDVVFGLQGHLSRYSLAGSPDDRSSPGKPVLLDSTMTPPVPLNCGRLPAPERARMEGTTGMVLVEYVVHENGVVSHVALRNPEAPAVLFEAVRGWLLACRFEPSKDLRSGQPVAVKIIQPFVFRLM